MADLDIAQGQYLADCVPFGAGGDTADFHPPRLFAVEIGGRFGAAVLLAPKGGDIGHAVNRVAQLGGQFASQF